jgi:hypothetical protein
MRSLKRKICDSIPCRESPFFRPLVRGGMDSGFFQPRAMGSTDKLAEAKPFKDWYEPKVEHMEYSLWDRAHTEDRSAMLTYLGLNLGTDATSFGLGPQVRWVLSKVPG